MGCLNFFFHGRLGVAEVSRHEARGDGFVEAIKFRELFRDDDRWLDRLRLRWCDHGRWRDDDRGRFHFGRLDYNRGLFDNGSFFGDGGGALVHFRQALLEEIGRNQSEEGEEDPEKRIR